MDLVLESLRCILDDRVTDSQAELCCYSSDASLVRGSPRYVARPNSALEVSSILAYCHEHKIPVTPRGAGTGLAGGAVPLSGGIVLDMSGMNRIIELDLENLQVTVEPGIVQSKLNQALEPYGFFFPPNPGSSKMCTIGGMIANNASGMRCVKYGTTRYYVLDLEVVLADGTVIRTGSKMLKSSAGYDLSRLIVGSEGTLGVITAARLKIVPLPKARRLVLASFPSAEVAGRAVIRTFSRGVVPSACEILDHVTLLVLKRYRSDLALPSDGDLIMFEVDGTDLSTGEAAVQIVEVCSSDALSIREVHDTLEMESIWDARSLVGAAVSRLDPNKSRVYVGEDVGVPIKEMPALIRRVEDITRSLGLIAMKYGHIGDGNLHVALFIDVMDPDQWTLLLSAADEIHKAALSLGGTVSSEHGIGAARAGYMGLQWGCALEVMRSIKQALDPSGILNPGKLGL